MVLIMNKQTDEEYKKSKKVFIDFLKVFLLPMLVNKFFLVYFGVNYSNYPGRGYGYGVIIALLSLFITISAFLWKYRNIDDP